MNILVTGATGFVGINVVNALYKEHNVSVLARNTKKAENYFQDSVKIYKGDILDIRAIDSAMCDKDVLIHIAGLIKSFDAENLYLINRIGSRNVSEVAAKHKIKNIITISSLAARGPLETKFPVSHYGYSKLTGEYEFLKNHFANNLKILRPPIIYGYYEKELFTLFKMAKLGILPTIKDKLFSFIFIEDLVDAIKRLIDLNVNYSKTYYVSDGNVYSWSSVADSMFESVGKKGVKLRLNPIFANIIAYSTYWMKDKAPFTLDKINEIKADRWICDYEGLRNDTGFIPKYNLKKGFKETYEWYRKNRWL